MNDDASHIFSEFTKQSPVSIIILIWKYFINIIRQFWPAIIAIFIGNKSANISNLVGISIAVVAVSSLVFAISYYLRFSFRVRNDELFIQKGVFKKSKLNIPFERIQTLNFEQIIIHQIFNVVKIDVDTAGSSKNEFSFNALEKGKAETLRALVMERKSTLQPDEATKIDGTQNIEDERPDLRSLIFKLEFKDLFLIGLTQNHLRTIVLLFFFCLWGLSELEEAGIKLDWLSMENAEAIFRSGAIIIVGFTLLLLIITIIGTSIRTILRYFDFKLFRDDKGFKIQSGLINRKEYAALDHKIQQIKWINNPLKRILQINQLQLKQASSVEVSAKKSIRIPGIQMEKIKSVLKLILGEEFEFDRIRSFGIDRRYFLRILFYFAVIPWLVLSIGGWYFSDNVFMFLILLIIPYTIITSYVAFKKWRFGISDEIIYTHHGIFENKNNIVQLHKIQNIKVVQSPFQWRRNLATLKIYSAAGAIHIPYLSYKEANQMKDYLLYKIETSSEKWY